MPNYFDENDIAKLIQAQTKEIELYVANLTKEIDSLLIQAVRQINPDLEINALLQILSKLSASNLPEKVLVKIRDSLAIYQGRVDVVREKLTLTTGLQVTFAPQDREMINAIFENDVATQLNTINETFNEFKQVAIRGMYTNTIKDLPTLQENLSQKLSGKLYSQTNTELASFQRAVTIKKAQDLGVKYFRYAGGESKNTRQFCRERIGMIFSIEDIRNMSNGQGLPVETAMGGWNCRHRWVAVLTEDAESRGITNGF